MKEHHPDLYILLSLTSFEAEILRSLNLNGRRRSCEHLKYCGNVFPPEKWTFSLDIGRQWATH